MMDKGLILLRVNGPLEIVSEKILEYEDIFYALKRGAYEEPDLNVTKIER